MHGSAAGSVFLRNRVRLAVGMQWEDLAEVEQADQTNQTVSSPECFSGGELALTFDDGPHRVYTKKLLDGLRERGVKASFFLVGEIFRVMRKLCDRG